MLYILNTIIVKKTLSIHLSENHVQGVVKKMEYLCVENIVYSLCLFVSIFEPKLNPIQKRLISYNPHRPCPRGSCTPTDSTTTTGRGCPGIRDRGDHRIRDRVDHRHRTLYRRHL